MKNYQPLGERVIILPTQRDIKSSSGLIIEEDTKFTEGIVKALGNAIKEPYYEIEDLVSYNRLKTEEIIIEGIKYHMIHHLDVVAIITK